MKKVLTHPAALVAIGVILGIAYGNRVPAPVTNLIKKLPGAAL